MLRGRNWQSAAVVLVTLALGLCAASAQDRAAGLVLQLDGVTTPEVAAYSELMDRSTVVLRRGADMSFVHYGTCRLVAVKGGRLYLDTQRYSLVGGRIVSVEKTDCPREQKLVAPGDPTFTAAGIVMRGVAGTPRLTAHPSVVLTGRHGEAFRTAELRRNGKIIGSMTVRGHLLSWPAAKPALAPGLGYRVRLKSADGKWTVDFVFSVAESDTPGDAAAILRLD